MANATRLRKVSGCSDSSNPNNSMFKISTSSFFSERKVCLKGISDLLRTQHSLWEFWSMLYYYTNFPALKNVLSERYPRKIYEKVFSMKPIFELNALEMCSVAKLNFFENRKYHFLM